MSEKIYCKDCQFYEKKLCHRQPPKVVFDGIEAACGYPEVDEDDWCGSAKLKEELKNKEKENKINERKLERKFEFENVFESLKMEHGGEPVTVKELAERLGITEYGVRNWIKENKNQTTLRFKNGIVFTQKEDSEDN